MADDRRERADALFDQALDLEPEDRERWLEDHCAGDAELRALVERLLRASETTMNFEPGGALQGELADDLARELDSLEDGLVGQQLGHYEVVAELGRGGMAVVYLGQRIAGDFDQQVAIKLLRSELVSPDAIRRFQLERQILARSTHPNIARLLDGGITAQQRPYLVMERVDGEQIDHYCDARRLSIPDRLGLFVEIARAVDHAHRNLVVHRDIKPSNILVSAEGQVKLLDFGIAKLLDPDGAETTRTELRAMTPAFASPEQVLGEPVTTATDIYQLGMLLYLMLTGCWPYRVDSKAGGRLLSAITSDSPTRPSAALGTGRIREAEHAPRPRDIEDLAAERSTTPERLRRRLIGDLDTIVLKCLRKQPERRYGSAAQLIDDIEAHLAERPISARPDTLSYRAGKFFLRHKVASVVAGVGLLLLVSVASWDNLRLARERDRARLEASKATEVADFLTGLFAVAAPTRSLGEAVTARDLLDRGAARVRGELSGQPELQASMMTVIGSVYGELALFEEGEVLLQEAIAIHRQRADADTTELATALFALGELHERNKDLVASRRELEEALTLRRTALGPKHPLVARTETRLGALLVADGAIDEAQELLEHAIATLEPLDSKHPDLGRALTQLAVATRDRREYEQSIPLFERALTILEPALGPDHPDTVMALFNLAYSVRHVDNTAEAERLYLESIKRYEHLYGLEHPRVGTAYNNYSLLLRQLKRWQDAVVNQRHALDIWSKAFGPEHLQVAWAYNNLGLIEELQGNHAPARDLYKRSLEITEAAVEPEHVELNTALQNYARELTATGQPGAAIPYFLRALKIRERVYGPEHSFVGRTCTELGEAYLAFDQLAEAEAVLRRSIAIGLADGQHREHRVTRPTAALARTLARAGQRAEAERILDEERPLTNDEGIELIDAARAAISKT